MYAANRCVFQDSIVDGCGDGNCAVYGACWDCHILGCTLLNANQNGVLESAVDCSIRDCTVDGGKTWVPQTGLGMGTWRFFHRPGQPLYLLSFGQLHMSIDSGKTWTTTRTVEGPPGRTLSLYGRTGLIGGQAGMLAVSNDGGVRWRANNQGEEEQILASYLLDETTGYIGGYRAILKRTVDGGATWTTVAMPAQMDIAEFYLSGSYLYAVGTRGGIMREKVK